MNESFTIEKAGPENSEKLSELAFSSKSYWKYPQEYYSVWNGDLLINEYFLENEIVYKLVFQSDIIGFYSITSSPFDVTYGSIFMKAGFWLEHLFIDPKFIGKGFGKTLMLHALEQCRAKDVKELFILSDPHAVQFYEKFGAVLSYETDSNIIGRKVPILKIDI